jgi:hypothetical protein
MCRSALRFHLDLAFEGRHIIGCGLDAHEAGELVVDFDRKGIKFVFDAIPFNASLRRERILAVNCGEDLLPVNK